MKIVLTLNNYKYLTGSELYVFDVARELLKRNAEVTIIANAIGGEIAAKTPPEVSIYPFFDHPEIEPDLVVSSQPQPTSYALKAFPNAFHMQVLHSVMSFEEPLLDEKIMKYIAVRPEIKKFWTEKYPLLINKVAVVWNGVDITRFNNDYTPKKNEKWTTLFVGTFDHLRRDVIMDLVKDAAEGEKQLLKLVLPVNPFSETNLPKNVEVLPSRWSIEELVKECDETAGIFVGRTTIEGWLCGKPGLVYDVDEIGHILRKATYEVPKNLELFDSKKMAESILKEFEFV